MADWTVRETGTAFIERSRSKFYGYCIGVPDLLTFQKQLQQTKGQHPDATHAVYAYRIHEKGKSLVEKCTDDGEPSHTGGLPALGLLRHHDLVNTTLITIRLYGGVKLGKNNLLRTYLEVAQNALQNAVLERLEKHFLLQLSLTGPQYSLMMDQMKHRQITAFHSDFQNSLYQLSFSIKESDRETWSSFFQQYQIYSYAIIEQKNEGGVNEETHVGN